MHEIYIGSGDGKAMGYSGAYRAKLLFAGADSGYFFDWGDMEYSGNRGASKTHHKLQIELTYNSNHIEGSRLTHDQTRYIYETNTIGEGNETFNVDDIDENFFIEIFPPFRCNLHQKRVK